MIKLRDILKEIGGKSERSSTPYTAPDVKPSDSDGDIYDPEEGGSQTYRFDTGEDKDQEGNPVQYTLVLTGIPDEERGEYLLDIDFFTEEGYAMTNVGKPLRLMATVAQIVKSVVDKDKKRVIGGVVYGPAEKDDEDFDVDYSDTSQKTSEDPVNQRDRLYRLFISKELGPGNVEFFDQAGNIIAKFKNKRTKK